MHFGHGPTIKVPCPRTDDGSHDEHRAGFPKPPNLPACRKDGHSQLVDDAGIKKRHSADFAVPEGNTTRLEWGVAELNL